MEKYGKEKKKTFLQSNLTSEIYIYKDYISRDTLV